MNAHHTISLQCTECTSLRAAKFGRRQVPVCVRLQRISRSLSRLETRLWDVTGSRPFSVKCDGRPAWSVELDHERRFIALAIPRPELALCDGR